MDNQYDALVPYRLEYISLTFHKANNTKLKLTIELNISIYDNRINYL